LGSLISATILKASFFRFLPLVNAKTVFMTYISAFASSLASTITERAALGLTIAISDNSKGLPLLIITIVFFF
jgi:hypothetical protein